MISSTVPLVKTLPIERPNPRSPEWLPDMECGRWYRLSGDHPDLGLSPTAQGTRFLRDCDPALDRRLNPARRPLELLRRMAGRTPLAPWSGRNGFASITECWNGAVLATRFGACGSLVVFGGGHNDYFGSDVHAFDLGTREWRRICDGYTQGTAHAYGTGACYPSGEYPDGSPLPPHTYGYVQYDPVGNDYLILKSNSELGPNVKAVATPHMLNLDSLAWRRGPQHPQAILNSGGFTTWDSKRRLLWGHSGDDGGGNAFIGFCPDGAGPDGTFGHWGPMYDNKFSGHASHNVMQIDPRRDIIVVGLHQDGGLHALDPSNPAARARPLRCAGETGRISECAAMEFAPNLDRLVYYSARDGASVYTIAAPDPGGNSNAWRGVWQWSRLDGDGPDPIEDAREGSRHADNWQHTFGRFRVASWDGIDVALLIRHIDSPVYALRLN